VEEKKKKKIRSIKVLECDVRCASGLERDKGFGT